MRLQNTTSVGLFALAATLLLGGCGAGQDGATTNARQALQSGSPRFEVVPPSDGERVSTGENSVVALNSDGTVFTWGDNSYGQLGTGTYRSSKVPVLVAGLSGVRAVRMGAYHTLALRQDGTVWAWGANYSGQLGNGAMDMGSKVPLQVPGMSNVKAVAAGQTHSSAVTNTGEVWGWGYLPGRSNVAPARVVELRNVQTVTAGVDFNLALKNDGTVWGWGNNFHGQLGIGTRSGPLPPTQVLGLNDVIAVSAGQVHALALRRDGSVWSWGGNYNGQLGTIDGPSALALPVSGLPTPINGASGVKAVVAGIYNSAVLYTDGSVWAWGDNSAGQLGNGSTLNSNVPVRINSVNNIVALSIGDRFIILVDENGAAYSIGTNVAGQLGNNTSSGSTLPVQVAAPAGAGILNLGKSTGR